MTCEELIKLPIMNLRDLSNMWTTLQCRLNDDSHQTTRTAILRNFQAARYNSRNGLARVDPYFAEVENYQHQLTGSAEQITEEGLKTHIFSTLMGHFYTTLCIMQRQRNPEPSAKQVMDSSWEEAKTTEVNKELGDLSVGSVLISHQTGFRGRGYYRGNNGNRDGRNDVKLPEFWCTHCRMNNYTTENCAILKPQSTYTGKSGSGDFSKNTDDKLCFHCRKPGHIKSECRTCQRGGNAQNNITKRRNGNGGSTTTEASTAHGIIARESGQF
jgi:hypothetical protein